MLTIENNIKLCKKRKRNRKTQNEKLKEKKNQKKKRNKSEEIKDTLYEDFGIEEDEFDDAFYPNENDIYKQLFGKIICLQKKFNFNLVFTIFDNKQYESSITCLKKKTKKFKYLI